MTLVVRWVLTDPVNAATYTFTRNPREMTSPLPSADTTALLTTFDGRTRAKRATPRPVEWTVTGDIRTQDHHDALLAWAAKDYRVHLSDHLGRTFDILITALDVTEVRPRRRTPWRASYELRALVYGVLPA